MINTKDGTTVTVTSKGQATIPREFHNKLNIDTPGRVRFVENEQRGIVIRSVTRPSELRGALASKKEQQAKSDTELLREEREQDRKETDEKFGLSEQEQCRSSC